MLGSALCALVLTLPLVKAHYAGTKGLDAEIEQTKVSPFLVKPLVSKIHLTAKPGQIRWEVREPVAASFVFDDSGKSPFPENDKTKALVSFIKALVTVDFALIEKDFDLVPDGAALIATPRQASALAGMIKSLTLRFDDNLSLKSLHIDAANETTDLIFKSLTLVKP